MSVVPCVVVLYDSVSRPDFQECVLKPLLKQLNVRLEQHIIVVAYETQPIRDASIFRAIEASHDNISCTVFAVSPTWTLASLKNASTALRTLLVPFSAYRLIARDALAAYVAKQACDNIRCLSLMVQTHTILAERYAPRPHVTGIARLFSFLAKNSYYDLECLVYHRAYCTPSTTIEAISQAMKSYLVEMYDADPARITLAPGEDLEAISEEERLDIRYTVRNELGILHTAPVYCYESDFDSACTPDALALFACCRANDPNSVLLFLTTNPHEAIHDQIRAFGIPDEAYRIVTTDWHTSTQYLFASNTGIIVQQKTRDNYVSRPAQVIRYKAAHLAIAHNNTCAWLIEQRSVPQQIVVHDE